MRKVRPFFFSVSLRLSLSLFALWLALFFHREEKFSACVTEKDDAKEENITAIP